MKKECKKCKYKLRLWYKQPCRWCIMEGYGGYPLFEPEEENDGKD